jgi:peptidyl-tRNA hydrolase
MAIERFVLSKFSPDEKVLMDEAIIEAADAIEAIIRDGHAKAMNTYNQRT